MLAFIGSIFSGGITGLLGVGVQRFFDFLKVKQELEIRKIDHEHEVNMRRIDGELMAQEWSARTQVATIEATAKETAASEASFAASFGAEPQQYSARAKIGPVAGFLLVLLDFLRGVVRPGLTVYLCAITTMIYFEARTIMSAAAFSTGEAIRVHELIVSTILYLTTTCVLWWFGTRNRQRPPK